MAMTMTGEYQLPASQQAVWEKLNDPAVLKACIPGCQELEKTGDNGFKAIATIKIGPVKATFKGAVTLSDLDPPNGYKISGQGEGGVAGFAKGGAVVKLAPKDGGTLLSYNVEAQIGGKLAQLGQRLVNGAAKKVADDFFHHQVSEVWKKSRSAILERRQTAGRETAFQFLEWLATSQTAFRERQSSRKRSAYPLAQRADTGAHEARNA